jgi:hypothetical protein
MAEPKNSIPTLTGWVHPTTGELLKSQKLSPAFIAEWHEARNPKPVKTKKKKAVKPDWRPVTPRTLHEAPATERELTEAEQTWHESPAIFAPQELKED